MIRICCDFPLEETEDYVSVQNMVISENVRITVVKSETADYEFVVNGPTLIEAIKKCIE